MKHVLGLVLVVSYGLLSCSKASETEEKFSTKPTCPGYVGSFITSKNIINYEYGMFASDAKQ